MCIAALLVLTWARPARAESTVASLDLYVGLQGSATTASSGDTLTLTVLLGNDGDFGAEDAVVRVSLPPGLTLLEASPGEGTFAADSGEWTLTDLYSFESATLALTVQVSGSEPVQVVAELISFAGSFTSYDVDSTPGNGAVCEDDYATFELYVLGSDAGAPEPPDCSPPDAGVGHPPYPCDGGWHDNGDAGIGADDSGGGCSAGGSPGLGAAFALLALVRPRRTRARTSS